MNHTSSRAALLSLALTLPLAAQPVPAGPTRTAKTGHVSNYDEAKVGNYTLPDPLVMANGQPVGDAETWFKQRRPELLELYRANVYGRVPASAPQVTWRVAMNDPAPGGATIKKLTGQIGPKADGPLMNVSLYLPGSAKGPVPVVICLNFGAPANRRAATTRPSGGPTTRPANPAPRPYDPVPDVLAHGYACATITYTDIQPDNLAGLSSGVIGITNPGGERKGDDWGSISAWAWGLSQIIDYCETDSAIDAKHVAIFGHSRLGKTALWAGAQDARISVVYSSCSGELGASLSRRDFGESVDDVIQNFPWWFCPNFQKYAGKWNDLPVDSHTLIALNAPHGVYITGGTEDQWADPKGEFLAAVAAGPVYRLVGKKDLGVTELPGLDQPVIGGDLAWHYHTGAHAATKEDWGAFLEFAGRYLK